MYAYFEIHNPPKNSKRAEHPVDKPGLACARHWQGSTELCWATPRTGCMGRLLPARAGHGSIVPCQARIGTAQPTCKEHLQGGFAIFFFFELNKIYIFTYNSSYPNLPTYK